VTRNRLICVALLSAGAAVVAAPNRYGFSDRVERHMFPAVSTGPLDPAWSPDGRWIAFSMRGDIWKVPAEGGEAVALTGGPAYHFEPAWSPDGTRVAFSMDLDGNLDLGLVDANGSNERRLTTNPSVELEPAWTHDGRALFFATSRAAGFDIYRLNLDEGTQTAVVSAPRDQIQPAVSPDGRTLAYVSPVDGRLGTGGIWVKPLPDSPAEALAKEGGQPTLVHYEESEYRLRPAWTPDGKAFVFGSDEKGSNDIAIVPARGGNPNVLTPADTGEFSPAVSPDGSRIAFVSNGTGAMILYTAAIGGGPAASWNEVRITGRRPATPSGRARVRVLGPEGQPMPARIYPLAADGRAYAPDGGFHRVIAITETHYFNTTGTFELEVPAGRLSIEAMRGFEYVPATVALDVKAGGTAEATIRLQRLIDAPARGWYSGDTHVHDLHQGRFGLSHEIFFDHLRSEDLHVTNALIHMDGTRLMGRWADLTGKPSPLSTKDYILQYGEEFRGSLGHVALIGIGKYVLPFNAGEGNTAYAQPVLDFTYLDAARAQGGIGGYVHPYTRTADDPAAFANSLIPVDVALGHGDFYDVGTLFSDEVASTEMYYRLLNCGFRLAATSGSDNFSDVWRDPPPGADRGYVRVQGPLTLQSWMAGIKAGRTFGTTGPLLFLTVDGKEPGTEIAIAAGQRPSLPVHVEALSIAPLDTLDVVVNGKVAATAKPTVRDGVTRATFDGPVEIPDGGWIAARVKGPASRYVSDSYAFAATSPVYVLRGGKKFTSAADAEFLGRAVRAIWERVDARSPWRTDQERQRFLDAIEKAEAVYRTIAEGKLH
jgi:TolB protein